MESDEHLVIPVDLSVLQVHGVQQGYPPTTPDLPSPPYVAASPRASSFSGAGVPMGGASAAALYLPPSKNFVKIYRPLYMTL